jgi:hypothetical protein
MREVSYRALVIPTKVGIQFIGFIVSFVWFIWIPVYTGMTIIFATSHR